LSLNSRGDGSIASQNSSIIKVDQQAIGPVYNSSGPFDQQAIAATYQTQTFHNDGNEFDLNGDFDPPAVPAVPNSVITSNHARTFSQESFDSTDLVHTNATDLLDFANINIVDAAVPSDLQVSITMTSPFDPTIERMLLEPDLFDPNHNLEAHLGLGATVHLQP